MRFNGDLVSRESHYSDVKVYEFIPKRLRVILYLIRERIDRIKIPDVREAVIKINVFRVSPARATRI